METEIERLDREHCGYVDRLGDLLERIRTVLDGFERR